MVSLAAATKLVELASNIRLRSFTSGDAVKIWMAVMLVTILSVTIYSFDIDPSWMALLVISGGLGALSISFSLPVFLGPATFLAGAVLILHRR